MRWIGAVVLAVLVIIGLLTLLGQGPTVPGKYFSVARCFRYDQVDATHATDFFQIEGIVLGPDITFRTLLGLLNLFAQEAASRAPAVEVRIVPPGDATEVRGRAAGAS